MFMRNTVNIAEYRHLKSDTVCTWDQKKRNPENLNILTFYYNASVTVITILSSEMTWQP